MSDCLSDLLAATRIRGSLYFSTEFFGEWGVAVPNYQEAARFHYVARGQCWVRIEGVEAPCELHSGDLVVIPFGRAHILSDQRDRSVVELDEAVAQAGFTGRGALVLGDADRGAPTRLLCGHFEYDEPFVTRIFTQMPPAIILRKAEIGDAFWLHEGVRFLSAEAERARPGREAMAQKISEMLFIDVMRRYAESNPGGDSIFAAAQDSRISRALEAVHADVSAPWTVEAMAGEAGMSRAAFAQRFEALMGVPPMTYLAEWRLMLARRLLSATDLPLASVAHQSGYESEAGFSRAFKRSTDLSPGAFRKSRRRS